MSTAWIDIEADAFGVSKVHEYVIQTGEYRFSYESRLDFCIKDLEKLLERLQGFAPQHDLMICLGHSTNFRYGVYPRYKSNRRGLRRAACYDSLRKWLQANYSNCVLKGVEADDVVGVMYQPGDLIYSPDKDLRTIAGDHLLVDGTIMTVPQLEADRAFFKQVMTGDSSDGYGGIPNVGGSHKMFASEEWLTCKTEQQFWTFVEMQYHRNATKIREKYSEDATRMALVMARCARILRRGEYDFDNEKPVLWEGPS